MPRVWVWAVGSLLACGALACANWEDCKLYHTCESGLSEIAAVARVTADGAGRCFNCLNSGGSCKQSLESCSVDLRCNQSARCRMTESATEYQECIQTLYSLGYTDGREPRKPWEGNYWVNDPKPGRDFMDCFQDTCREECAEGRFRCSASASFYREIEIMLAIRKYTREATGKDVFSPANDARACLCTPAAPCDFDDFYGPEADHQCADADPSGLVKLPPERPKEDDDDTASDIPARSLHFLIVPQKKVARTFPETLFYPRQLGSTGLQLASAYVVHSEDVAAGNETLGFGRQVLTDRAQSLILPDGCFWEENSLPDVTISVEREGEPLSVPQCSAPPGCNGCGQPCVWYGRERGPTPRLLERTDGTGAGVAGLPAGIYQINAMLRGTIVSQRSVEMRPGWMTIARTWPTGNVPPEPIPDRLAVPAPGPLDAPAP